MRHHKAGRLREAERAYREVLGREPNHVDALHQLGVIAGQTGHARDAAALIGRAAALQPANPVFQQNLAAALRQEGRMKEAAAASRQAAAIYRNQGKNDEAGRQLKVAAELDPSPDILHELETILFHLQRFDECARVCHQALAIEPNDLIALSHLCIALQALGRSEEARGALDRALAIPCTTAEQWFHRGLALTSVLRTPEAYDAYREALRLDATFLVARLNLGESAALLGRSDEALAAYREVVKAAPGSAVGHLGYALALLLRGQLEAGFVEHLWRGKCLGAPPARNFAQPLWGGENIGGKTLLLHAEQGYGDTIQFARYATLAHIERGARVILEVQPPLVELMRTLPGVECVIAQGDRLPSFDVHLPLMDLPLSFRTTMNTIPAQVPYLAADPQKVQLWSEQLVADEPSESPRRPRIGVAWSGSPVGRHNHNKSISFATLEPMIEALGERAHFISLQKGQAVEEAVNRTTGQSRVRDYSNALHDFSDTAAMMMNLDLIISVDTSVAHLAGALARPVWVPLALGADWRWFEHRDDSPWYPAMRLFRQRHWSGWSDVIDTLAAALIDLIPV
jgi:tetratricopeptide (TPR) repeat protein